MNRRETNLLQTLTHSGPAFYTWIAFLGAVISWGIFAYILQLRFGLIETGMGDQISWGLYITNFVFFIGISHAGTLISAILRVTDAGWRRPITRMAEGITVVALCIGSAMVVVDMGRPERLFNVLRYGRIQSPILWDVLGVTTYLTGCVLYFYLPLIPDLGILASDRGLPAARRKLYSVLSLGWTGTPTEWKLLEKAISVMAVFIIPLAISVHTVVSWIFAMTLRPGWDSSIFGPYFVVGAIYSGAAAVILAMCIFRRVFHLEDYLAPVHFRNLGWLLLSFSGLYLYFNINEYLTISYKFQEGEKRLLTQLFEGPFSTYFWAGQVTCILIPFVLLVAVLAVKRCEPFLIPVLGLASFLVILGAWIKRFVIVVPTLASPFLPAQRLPEKWMHYSPSWVEWSITAAAFAAFLLLYTVLAKLFPVVSLWETREAEPADVEHGTEAVGAFGPRNWGPVATAVLLCVLGGGLARGETAAKNKKMEPLPVTISATWKALPPEAPLPQPATGTYSARHTFLFSKPLPGFSTGRAKADEVAPEMRPVEIEAQARDARGEPLAFQAIGFSLKGALGTLDFGSRPSDGEGKVKLVIRDRRYGRYPVTVSFEGDESHQPGRATVLVDFGPRPAPALPVAGVLISPYFSPEIGLPFLFFYGVMWCAFAYSFGYLVLWRMRRERAHRRPL
ncbi:MAG: polysulfide reductase NrfD [Acidobacteria bacterium]|nr:polysulfide reductase NrfD [Acidobacteriota bacterium]MBI3280596.1 polysulfide reductase NrfD [Acidobacteriota bacterium]